MWLNEKEVDAAVLLAASLGRWWMCRECKADSGVPIGTTEYRQQDLCEKTMDLLEKLLDENDPAERDSERAWKAFGEAKEATYFAWRERDHNHDTEEQNSAIKPAVELLSRIAIEGVREMLAKPDGEETLQAAAAMALDQIIDHRRW